MQLTAEQEQDFERHLEERITDPNDEMLDDIVESDGLIRVIHSFVMDENKTLKEILNAKDNLMIQINSIRKKELQRFLLDRNELDGDTFQ